jgi:metallo-beta-lactamase family protein
VQLQALSAHADGDELLDWMRTAPTPPSCVYVTHGEPAAGDTLRARIQHELGWTAHVPEQLQEVVVGAAA